MKRSMTVTLVLSGSLLVGCNRRESDNYSYMAESGDTVVTNNTYSPGQGYYHSGFHSWYPYPHNFYEPGRGYYYGGRWSAAPDTSATHASVPPRGSSRVGGSHVTTSGSVSRGGFGFHGSSAS